MGADDKGKGLGELMSNPKISPQERKLVESASKGETDKEVARKLDVKIGTIRTYWERIRTKLKTLNKTHSVANVIQADHAAEIRDKDAEIAELKAEAKE